MRSAVRVAGVLSLAAQLSLPLAAHAAVSVVFGTTSWDGAASLQSMVDARYGAGHVNVTTDYIGAHPGDIDPWFWVDREFSAFLVKEVAGNANRNVIGWYREPESFNPPAIDGVDDGIVFDGPAVAGATRFIVFDRPTKFGFWLNPNGGVNVAHLSPGERFWTNRMFNDLGPDGAGALHAPFDGDVQALVFDVSPWTQPDTWLVCFEDLDTGSNPASCCTGTDNDFNDFVFEIHAFGATPVLTTTLGGLKARYR